MTLPAAITLYRFEDRQQCADALASHLATALRRDIAGHGRAALALSGGSTPMPMFQALSQCPLDWSQVTVTLADERWVAPDHPDSNQAKVAQHLLRDDAANARFIPLWNPSGDDSNSAASQQRALASTEQALADLPDTLSVVVLGMGNDGHTASLFPCSNELPALWQADTACGWCQPTTAPHRRITLTPTRLLASRERILHLNGQDKLDTLNRALADGDRDAMPIRYFFNQPLTIFWAP